MYCTRIHMYLYTGRSGEESFKIKTCPSKKKLILSSLFKIKAKYNRKNKKISA